MYLQALTSRVHRKEMNHDMYTFIFCYENTTKHQFEHITRVEYSSFGKQTIVSENELLSHHFPTGQTLHLFSETANFTVSGNQLSYIEVQKED